MPELPEVERFRQILLPLVTSQKKNLLSLELHGENPPRKWVSAEEVNSNTDKWFCTDVLRKGKLLCKVLEGTKKETTDGSKNETPSKKYFYLHMGMTGCLVSTTMSCSWGHKYVYADPVGEWPPKYTYLILTTKTCKVAFADPRKFGSCKFSDSLATSFDELAPDGLTETATPSQCESMAAGIVNQRLGIKALILDQKRVVSGVGNWVADEVLYQCEMHPDQSYLTDEQASNVVEKLHSVLSIAVDCLDKDIPYPDRWLFGFRWTKKKAGKDFKGRSLSFLVSGGRTSAIVASMQKLQNGQAEKAVKINIEDGKKKKKSLKGPEKKRSGTVDSAAEEKENAMEDRKPGVVISKKRKLNSKVKQEANDRPRRRCKSEEHTPDEVPSLAFPSPVPSPKEPKNKPQRKQIVKKESKRKRKDKIMVKQEEAESDDDNYADTSSNHSIDGDDIKNVIQNIYKKSAREFSLEKEAMLKQVDKSVKDDFREVGFAKWKTSWLPIIQLGPYDVSPGPVRDGWMKIFQKTNKAPRLVYWYGSGRDDLSSSFSFLNKNAIVSYDEGIKKGRDKFPPKIMKKVSTGRKLTATDNLIVEGLKELKDESALVKEERLGWLKVENDDFMDADGQSSDKPLSGRPLLQ